MKLLFRQRLFWWFDSYDIYDENEKEKCSGNFWNSVTEGKSPFIRTDPACYRDKLPPGHAVDIRDGSYNRVKIPESGHCRGCGLQF